MAEKDKPATPLAKKLVTPDYQEAMGGVMSLGQQRMINSGLLQQSLGQFNPEYIDLQRLYQMRRDPMIQMGLHYVKAPILRAKWHIECEDPAIAAGVDQILRRAYGPYMRTALNMLDFGYQGAIKVFELGDIDATYETADGNIEPVWKNKNVKPLVLGAPIPIPPEWASVHVEKGKFGGISSPLGPSNIELASEPTIPPEFSLWFTNEFEETFRDYYGYPRPGYAYRYWWSYWFRFHMEDRHFEQDADPALMVWYPPGSYTDAAGNEKSNKDAALQIGADLRGGATVAMPSDVHIDEQGKATSTPLWKAEFLRGGENLQAFRQSSEYLDVMKLRSILVPEQALVEGKGGTSSKNVASTYGQIFTESLGQLADDIDLALNKYVIPQIVEANWGPDAAKVRKVTTGFQQEDLSLVTDLIKIAFNLDPNVLPINFDKLVEMANLPKYTQQEQKDRQAAAGEAQAQQAPPEGQPPAPQGPDGTTQPASAATVPNPAMDPNLQAAQAPIYRQKREVIYLDQHKEIDSTVPAWVRNEWTRRTAGLAGISEVMMEAVRNRYTAIFDTAKDVVETSALTLGVGGLLGVVLSEFDKRRKPYDDAIKAEMASMYHVSSTAELVRLNLNPSSWVVGRDEIQNWAEVHGGELIKTMDKTVVEQMLKPWLAAELPKLDNTSPKGVPGGDSSLELAARLSDKFEGYPEWMARRVIRTETRTGYNQSALNVWDKVGITEVIAYDGLGGLSGKTDAECLNRNGTRLTLAEAREEDRKEHPNGTLFFVPITDGVELSQEVAPGVVVSDPAQSQFAYAVTSDGYILGPEQVGTLLAGEGNDR